MKQVELFGVNSDLGGRLLGQFSSSATPALKLVVKSLYIHVGIYKIMLTSVLTMMHTRACCM